MKLQQMHCGGISVQQHEIGRNIILQGWISTLKNGKH